LFSLLLRPTPDDEDLLIGELWECGVSGISEEAEGLRAFFEPPAEAAALMQRFARFEPAFRDEAPADWVQATRDAWPPLLIGERLYLVAPWWESETPPGRLRLEIEPGMACGTGRHPATQLCLEALERYVRAGATVLDVGTGSGILAQAAALLGAGRVLGCDVDRESVAIAARRRSLNLFVGSAGAMRSGSADVIVANIDAGTIESLAPEFQRVRKPGSSLILSGFTCFDLPEGFTPRETLEREEWTCLIA
jgi:ribosomal protein L11 methyltransferase